MVSFTILLLLYLLNESAGILDDDADINSKLKLKVKSMQNGDSAFSKKFQSLTDKRLLSRLVDFKTFCRTHLKRCSKKLCRNGKCYIFVTNILKCFQIKKICTS